VADDGRVLPQAHDKLQHWSIHTDLGKLVADIVDILTTTRSSPALSAPVVMGVPVTSPSVYTYPPPQPKATSLPALSAWQNMPQASLPPPPSYASSVKGAPSASVAAVSSSIPSITVQFPELEGKR